jgi:hypothetical protein
MAAECRSTWHDRQTQIDVTESSDGSDVYRHLDGKSARAAANSRVSHTGTMEKRRTMPLSE